MATDRPCANPACRCQTSDVTCSLWCGALDRPAGVRCLCRHDTCVSPLARTPLWTAARDPLTEGRRPSFPNVGTA